MKRFFIMFALALCACLPVCADDPEPTNVPLTPIIAGNNGEMEDIPRTPVRIPSVSLEDYTLYFDTPCDGCELRLLDENDNVVYSTTIPTGCASLQLPATLSGTYELQIIRGLFCFYGDIELAN